MPRLKRLEFFKEIFEVAKQAYHDFTVTVPAEL